MPRGEAGGDEASAARALERLAVLLEAGIAPRTAWEHLAEISGGGGGGSAGGVGGGGDGTGGDGAGGGGVGRVASAAAEALARGRPAAPAIACAVPGVEGRAGGAARRAVWGQVAAAWEVAETCGAPLGPALRAMASSLRAQESARRAAEIALAGPRTASRIVLGLPVVGVLLGLLLGIDSLGVLVGTPIGWGLLVAAALLVAIARRWSSALIAAAAPPSTVPGLEAELLAVAIGGGGAWGASRARVAAALAAHCPERADAGESAEVDEVLALSERSGAPGAELLRSLADERRRAASTAAAIAVERLGVLVMLPLGLCILPAFVLVGVVPMGVALLSSTGAPS